MYFSLQSNWGGYNQGGGSGAGNNASGGSSGGSWGQNYNQQQNWGQQNNSQGWKGTIKLQFKFIGGYCLVHSDSLNCYFEIFS